MDVTYTYDINSILEVEVKVVSTGRQLKQIFGGRNLDMSPEEIAERLFYEVDWQSPTTLMYEWETDGELDTCAQCGKCSCHIVCMNVPIVVVS